MTVTPLFGDGTATASTPEPRTYEIKLKDTDISFGPLEGYLVTNGYIVCLLEEFENANSVKFLANQTDLNYIIETNEVDEG